MEYLAKYISETMAEIIERPANPVEVLAAERLTLIAMISTEPELEKELIEAQYNLVKQLEGQVVRYSELMSDGFVEFICGQEPSTEPGQRLALSYKLISGKVYQIWTVIVDLLYYQRQISELKAVVASSDYKVIKCYEAGILGDPLPYDMVAIAAYRQIQRDEINRLESILANL